MSMDIIYKYFLCSTLLGQSEKEQVRAYVEAVANGDLTHTELRVTDPCKHFLPVEFRYLPFLLFSWIT